MNILKTIYEYIYLKTCKLKVLCVLWCLGIKNRHFYTAGTPIIDVKKGGLFSFGYGLNMINNQKYSTLGKSNKCKILVYKDASLIMGDYIGMSNVTIVATKKIEIGNRVMLGGGVTIVDSDFHSMNAKLWFTKEDELQMISLPVKIGNNVFIGMDSIILKGVAIGDNVRIAAGSIVTKNIPNNEIWGGNPAKFIKSI